MPQNLTYKVESIEMHVPQMVLPKEAMDLLAKPMQYEFMSWDHFLDTVPSNANKHQVQIGSVATRAKAVYTMLVDINTESDNKYMNYYAGSRPSETQLNSVQYFINNRKYPETAYNPSHLQDKPVALNELVKAFTSTNISVQNLGSNEHKDLNNYSNTFLVARELARGDFVFPLKDSEPELRLSFSGTRDVNFRVYTFVFSKKIIDVSPKGLSVLL